MKRIFIFLFIALGMFDAMAKCVPTTAVTKCLYPGTLDDGGFMGHGGLTDLEISDDGMSWRGVSPRKYIEEGYVEIFTGQHPLCGIAPPVLPGSNWMGLCCIVTSPFKSNPKGNGVTYRPDEDSSPAEVCANEFWGYASGVEKLDGDECPDGFFTVPYETTCGEGMVDDSLDPYTNDNSPIPLCSEYTSGRYCLIVKGTPCGAISDCGAVSFTNDGNGKYALKYTACSGGMCAQSETQVSACGNGYYGDGITCTRCPQNIMSDIPTYTDNGNGALIINANAREERDCYVTPEMKFSDLSGSYSYESNCSYAPGYVY